MRQREYHRRFFHRRNLLNKFRNSRADESLKFDLAKVSVPPPPDPSVLPPSDFVSFRRDKECGARARAVEGNARLKVTR
jgi:hypothetical protein